MRRWLGNPRVHFVLLGVLVFALDAAFNDERGTPTLNVSPDGRELVRVPENLPGTATDARTWAEREVLYREARRMGFDEDDTIVRRRMVQKMRHLLEMTAAGQPYTREDVRAYFEARREDYRRPARYDLAHVYLDPGRHGGDLPSAAHRIRVRLNEADAPTAAAGDHGDTFVGRNTLHGVTAAEVRAQLGDAFWRSVHDLPAGRWHGPVESKYGQHLVRMEQVRSARTPALEAVWDQVVHDFERHRRETARQRLVEKMMERYRIVGLPHE